VRRTKREETATEGNRAIRRHGGLATMMKKHVWSGLGRNGKCVVKKKKKVTTGMISKKDQPQWPTMTNKCASKQDTQTAIFQCCKEMSGPW